MTNPIGPKSSLNIFKIEINNQNSKVSLLEKMVSYIKARVFGEKEHYSSTPAEQINRINAQVIELAGYVNAFEKMASAGVRVYGSEQFPEIKKEIYKKISSLKHIISISGPVILGGSSIATKKCDEYTKKVDQALKKIDSFESEKQNITDLPNSYAIKIKKLLLQSKDSDYLKIYKDGDSNKVYRFGDGLLHTNPSKTWISITINEQGSYVIKREWRSGQNLENNEEETVTDLNEEQYKSLETLVRKHNDLTLSAASNKQSVSDEYFIEFSKLHNVLQGKYPFDSDISKIQAQMQSFADAYVKKSEYAGLKVAKGNSGAVYIQEASSYSQGKEDEGIISIKDGKIRINGQKLEEITDVRLISQAHAMLARAGIGKLFQESRSYIHENEVLMCSIGSEQYYMAKTKKNGEDILFVQDSNAWKGKGQQGISYSINLTTHTIWKNGQPALITGDEAQFLKNLIGSDARREWKRDNITIRSRDNDQATVSRIQEETHQWNETSKDAPPMEIPGLRYTGDQELASRRVYLSEALGTKMSYIPSSIKGQEGTVLIDTTKKENFQMEKFISQLVPWLGSCKKVEGAYVFTDTFRKGHPYETTVTEKDGVIRIVASDYVKVIDGGGDRWMSRYCS